VATDLPDRHQETIRSGNGFLTDYNMSVVFGTHILAPPNRFVDHDATVALFGGPGTRQRMVDRGDFVVQKGC
jgi:hypothetical protein